MLCKVTLTNAKLLQFCTLVFLIDDHVLISDHGNILSKKYLRPCSNRRPYCIFSLILISDHTEIPDHSEKKFIHYYIQIVQTYRPMANGLSKTNVQDHILPFESVSAIKGIRIVMILRGTFLKKMEKQL